MDTQIKLKTNLKVSQALPYIEKVAKYDGLRTCIESDFKKAWGKLKLLLIICEQNGLQYWVNKDFRIANHIYDRSLDFRIVNNMYDITLYKN